MSKPLKQLDQMTESAWRRLISKIREGNVVPIVGPRLLVNADGQSLLGEIARHLLNVRGVDIEEGDLPPFAELTQAVSRLKMEQELYDDVNDAIIAVTTAPDFVIPTPIRQLSEISGFRLFVTLTTDNLLARSLREHCAVNEIVHSPNLATSEGKDLPPDWQTRSGEAHVLYLFGKSRSAASFAIHDEDILEYAHNLIARGSQVPGIFLAELRNRNLLLVGCNFPDWLQRFFLRVTNQARLSKEDRRAWLIEPLRPEESLTCFLRLYSKETTILSQTSPADFVAELHQRWMAESGGVLQDSRPEEEVPQGAMFFISYSRKTDLPRAEALYQALLRHGVTEREIWFDRKSIEPGQDFQRRILDGIRQCKYFLPLLSQACNVREEAFVFQEWKEANDRFPGMNRDFIFPVIVDKEFEPERYTAKWARMWADEKLDFAHAPEGTPDPRLGSKLKELVRNSRRGAGPS